MNEKTAHRLGIIAIIALAFIAGFLLIITPQEQRNYEVRGADGTVYHTTSISHGTGRIWFTDESGNRVELGGGYTVIQK
jgi:subtilisin family serine protease